ncbi:MAG: right-handed parallel beta-helix repeat-containing protein [Treponema sp.]|jgi:hypothetical protein|nr:right-handed parallel beta-helix repeat-containing protein [Treponema sp.]
MVRSGTVFRAAALLPVLGILSLAACKNPYIIHDLNRPVYLSGLEVRSDQLGDDDPSHPLNQVFQNTRTSYTVTVPYTTETVTVNGIPEEGAGVNGAGTRSFAGEQEAVFTLTVYKDHRESTVYTVRVLRGLPEAVLMGLELYVSSINDAPPSNAYIDPENFEKYEHDNYILDFVPHREKYVITVPAFTNNIALMLHSFHAVESSKVKTVTYTFKDHLGNVLGADGKTPAPGYLRTGTAGAYHQGPLPSWYDPPVINWGHIEVYAGGQDGKAWFGAGIADFVTDENPKGPGKFAVIEIVTSSDTLSQKRYIIEIQREPGSAYLEGLEIFAVDGTVPLPAPAVNPKADITSAVVDEGKNRLVGNFSRTGISYDAVLPEAAKAVQIRPKADYRVPSPEYTYIPWYYDQNGKRWYVNSAGAFQEHPAQGMADPLPFEQAPTFTSRRFPGPGGTGPENFYFDVTSSGFVPGPGLKFVSMEVVIISQSADNNYIPKTYRIMIRRQLESAVLRGITVEPYAVPDIPYPGDNNVFLKDDGTSRFNPQVATYTVPVNAGRTHARVTLDNDSGSPSPNGTDARVITVTAGSQTVVFTKTSLTSWRDQNNTSFTPHPYVNVELKSRNTAVSVHIEDPLAFTANEYTLNLLSKNTNEIVLPLDEASDGRVKAVFAPGTENAGMTARYVLPGELVRLTVDANLGYYVDWSVNAYAVPGGTDGGVICSASTLTMGSAGVKLISSPGDWKHREYQFYMPDENVQFEIRYRPTVTSLDNIAYVAAEARRGGGYGSGDGRTGKSWGTASSDLQAVINSWTGNNFTEIWVHKGTYTPPDPDVWTVYPGTEGSPHNPFSSNNAPPSSYNARGKGSYTLGGMGDKKDIAFVLQQDLRIYGGFEETHDSLDDRFTGVSRSDAAKKTILSGEFSDGQRAHHVVLAVDAAAPTLDTLTIAGAIGPESPTSITVQGNGRPPRTVSRQHGGGIYNVNSDLRLKNVIIRNNKSTMGAGIYTVSNGADIHPILEEVEFFSNTALQSGGGMYVVALSNNCTPEIRKSLFRDNKSSDRGGGFFNQGGNSRPVLVETTFTSNSAREGGGIYTSGGTVSSGGDTASFTEVVVENNWTSGSGSGIYNASTATFRNLTVKDNVSINGNGIGMYNSGFATMTNVTISNNRPTGSAAGGGLYNGDTVRMSNSTITGNSAGSGGGVYNGGTMVLANVCITSNTATFGSGMVNYAREGGDVSAVLVNVTLDSNTGAAGGFGGGILNDYEGYAVGGDAGSVNVLLTNVRITGNEGAGIYNRYYYFGGKGINLTLANTTIAGNTGAGVYSRKWNGHSGAAGKFPVYVRFHNTVVYNNSGAASQWDYSGFSGFPADTTFRSSREWYKYSLLSGMSAIAAYNDQANHNLPDTTNPGFGSDYRPNSGSPLVDAAALSLYPQNSDDVLDQIYWNLPSNYDNRPTLRASLNTLLMAVPVYAGGYLGFPSIGSYFLTRDNSFNKGDLRPGPAAGKSRPLAGKLAIGAYEP